MLVSLKRKVVRLVFLSLLVLAMVGCNLQQVSTVTVPPTRTDIPTTRSMQTGVVTATDTELPPSPSPTETRQASQTPKPSATPTVQPTETRVLPPTETLTPTPVPTYVVLRGRVIVERANCRYGPGAPYLYKYGVYMGNTLEVIGRTDSGTWVLVQAIGGSNPCWVRADFLELNGDVMNVQPTYIPLPASPYYGPLTGVSAVRMENEVIVSWDPLYLRAGDDSEQTPYIVEAWVCQAGEIVFQPVGTYDTLVSIHDEWGCSEPSHARVTAAEKHGYTAFVEVPWPQAPAP
jgi:hypothetical protein